MPPRLPGTHVGSSMNSFEGRAKVSIDVFLDVACPFSVKIFEMIQKVAPQYRGKSLDFVGHVVPQPWHHQSCIMNEAILGVHAVAPDKTWAFFGKVGAELKKEFTDAATIDLSRRQITAKLIDVREMAESVGVERAPLAAALELTTGGTSVTQDLKFAIRFHRSRGIHVTPTVLVNGIEATQISSGWSEEEWKELLDPML